MNLYIRLKNNQPFEHPITEDNLLKSLPQVDVNNLPDYIARFIRTNKPTVGVYEIAEVSYVIENNVVREDWIVRRMSELEIKQKQESYKSFWYTLYPNSSFIFDETTCSFVSPIEYPNDGKTYEWSDIANNWIEIIPD